MPTNIQRRGLPVLGDMMTRTHSNQPIVIHLIQSLDSGGCENMLLRTLPEMKGFDHILITLAQPGELAPRFAELGFTVVNIGLASPFDRAGLRRLVAEILKVRSRLIMTYLFHADMIGRLYLQKHLRVPIIPFLRTTYNDRAYWLPRLMERLTKGRVAKYFANSEAVKQYYRKRLGVPASSIIVVPNGLDLAVFERADGASVRTELGILKNSLVVSCVANLSANKGHRYLLEAFEDFYGTHPKSYLILIGQGPELTHLKQQLAAYRSRGHVFFLGRRHDIANILKTSDIFVLPTLFEGMSNAILEAMAAGLAVITTDIPENRAIIDNNENGVLVEPGEARPIRQALKDLASNKNKREALGKAAKQTIAERFTLRAAATLWEKEMKAFMSL